MPEAAQRGLGVGGVTVDRVGDPLDADVRPDPERHEQLAPPRRLGVGDLARRDRRQLQGEPREVVGVLEDVEQVDRAVPRLDLAGERLEVWWFGQPSERRDDDPWLAVPRGDSHAAGGTRADRVVEALEAGVEALLEIGDERRWVAWLADRRVMHVTVVLKVARQILIGVAPALRAGDVDLASPQRVAQRAQHAQLIRDALYFAVLVDDGLAPLVGDDAVERDLFIGRIEALLTGGVDVAAEQLERPARSPKATSDQGCGRAGATDGPTRYAPTRDPRQRPGKTPPQGPIDLTLEATTSTHV